MRATFLCDFDGTVAPADIGKALVERFSTGAPERRQALLEEWRSGAIGHRELTVAECEAVRVTRDEAIALAEAACVT